ncbi:MAG: cytochrome c biogenesis protein CcsA [Gammaproteobacteria bacterium]|jgi:ABC-type uncharacterized transport system permease subunit
MNTAVIAIPAVVFYFAGGLSTGLRLFGNPDSARPPRYLGIAFGLVGALLHAAVLYQGMTRAGGLDFGFFHAFSLAAWTIVLLLLLSSASKPVENLGIVLLPIAAITILLALRYQEVRVLDPDAPWGLKMHVLISLLAYSLLALASMQAIMLAIQDRHLRRHRPVGFVRALPPLQTMETLLFEMITVGFLLLTVALASGFMFLEDMFAQHLVHKTVLGITAWTVFAVLLWGRWRFGWRGRTAIRWTLTGFAVLALAYFGSKAVLELILGK